MEDLSKEVALLSQVEESISGARNKNSKGNGYMVTPVIEVCKSDAGVASTVGCPIALEVSQAQGCQEVANSSGSGELPMHIAEHNSVGIVDDSLDKAILISYTQIEIQIQMCSPKLTYTNMKVGM
ncbi:hypothetical protein U1Q18_032292 [Sarracenia purpurea var. burkii]